MRTTLDIEDDVLAAAKELARQQHAAVGKVISNLVREALAAPLPPQGDATSGIAGFKPFPARGTIVTNEAVNRLRDSEGV